MQRLAIHLAVIGLAGTGCLGNHYAIPKGDLVRLAQSPARQRGESVRIIQGFAGDDGPPPAPEVRAGAVIIIDPGPGVGPAPNRRAGGAVGRGGKGFGRASLAKAKANDSKAWIVLAALAGVALATTEGARYDGWVRLHPMHPVHIYGPHGEYTWLPLAQLDSATAAWARKAFVRDSEGPWQPLGRAPLDRRGFAYSIYFGGAEFESADGSDNTGFISHIQFGLFPVQELGIALDVGLGWTENSSGNTLFDSRYALEIDLLPVEAGPFHAGVFAQGGLTARFEDGFNGEDKSDILFGGGALLQLEVTTRLAVSGRAGLVRAYDAWIADAGIGISVY